SPAWIPINGSRRRRSASVRTATNCAVGIRLSGLSSACRSTPAARHNSSRSSPSCPSAARRSAVWRPPTVADWVSRTLISGSFRQHVGTFVQGTSQGHGLSLWVCSHPRHALGASGVCPYRANSHLHPHSVREPVDPQQGTAKRLPNSDRKNNLE